LKYLNTMESLILAQDER